MNSKFLHVFEHYPMKSTNFDRFLYTQWNSNAFQTLPSRERKCTSSHGMNMSVWFFLENSIRSLLTSSLKVFSYQREWWITNSHGAKAWHPTSKWCRREGWAMRLVKKFVQPVLSHRLWIKRKWIWLNSCWLEFSTL